VRYEIEDHTADIMVRCYGDTLEECFGNAAYALFDSIADISAVSPAVPYIIEADGDDDESLLYAFLSELLFVHDSESVLLSDFRVGLSGGHVRCEARGEPIDLKRHRMRCGVKAITYHMLNVDRDVPSVTVIFDV
jgi:SHS2 domain-containing protein